MLADRLHYLLQHAEWVSNFDERTLQRAADDTRRQRVVAVRFTAGPHINRCTLAGDIRDRQQRPYRCEIEIQAHGARLTLDTVCSCP